MDSVKDEELYLEHIGVSILDGAPGPGSGRYPRGSGENPYQHQSIDILSRHKELKDQGLSETEIAKAMKLSTGQLRAKLAVANNDIKKQQMIKMKELYDAGYSKTAIGKELGVNESLVRKRLKEYDEGKVSAADPTFEFLKKQIDEKGMIDVGAGVERQLGVSETKFAQALEMLRQAGYPIHYRRIDQVSNPDSNQKTTLMVACPPGTQKKDVYDHLEDIRSIEDYHSEDNGKTFNTYEPPKSIDSSRIFIRYSEDGGKDKDGVIELRRDVEDISLGNSNYAQVRIGVDGTHYLKGMALYSNDIPEGYDIVFNTNKTKNIPMIATDGGDSVLKPMKKGADGNIDINNPFGAYIKVNGQRHYIDENGNKQLSVINKVREEGDWDEWSKTISSQFLSKQPIPLIKQQLTYSYQDKEAELKDILSLTNPTIRKYYLDEFAADCDKNAVSLKANAFPRQRTQVILPVPDLKDDEVYAPNFEDGEKLALVRYPHAGTFEIPIVTVNNKNKKAKDILSPNLVDAIGINTKVAQRLSGADFDGDTVVAIPTGGKVKINSTDPLPGLKGFDPQMAYPPVDGMKIMGKDQTQIEMGKISNLITDMTLKGAPPEDLAKAVRHSMVVIDANKHELNYKLSEKENDIPALKRKWQLHVKDEETGKTGTGASTLISLSGSKVDIKERQGTPRVNKETGELIFKESGRTRINKKGEEVYKTQEVKLGSITKDLYSLSSGTAQESLYADYGNKLKALANRARKISANTKDIKVNSSAKSTYKKEVDSLNRKLDNSLKLQPKERMAQIIANSRVKAILSGYSWDYFTKKEKGKIRQQQLDIARAEVGQKKGERKFSITQKEWNAIQAGAISGTKLREMLRFVEPDELRNYSYPESSRKGLSQAKQDKIKAMASVYTNKQIADALGISQSQVAYYLGKKN